MTTLQEIRQQYPQYKDVPDAALADALHQKFYSDVPREKFDQALGLTAAPAPTPGTPEVTAASVASAASEAGALAPANLGPQNPLSFKRQYPDLPIFEANNADPGQQFKFALGTLLAASPEAERDIALKQLPGVKIEKDTFGNYIADFNGERGYINPKGLTQRDIEKGAFLTALFAPIASGATALAAKAGGEGLLARMGAQAIAGGGSSVLTDLGAMGMGSKQGVSPGRALDSAAGGVLSEMAGSGLHALANRFAPGVKITDDAGNLTPEAAAAFREAGFDPEELANVSRQTVTTPNSTTTIETSRMPDKLVASFQEQANRAGVTPAAARAAIPGEFGIPTTRGQATGDVGQIAWEEAARNNAKGNIPGLIVRSGDQARADAIAAARGNIAADLAGGQSLVDTAADAGARVREGVRSRAGALSEQIENAYSTAAEPTKNAFIDASAAQAAPSSVRQALQNRSLVVDDRLHPASTTALREIDDFSKFTGGANPSGEPIPADGTVTGVNLQGWENLRRRVGSLFSDNMGSADKMRLTTIKQALDDHVDNAVDQGLMSGDPAALDALKQARTLRAQYSRSFGARNPRDDAGKLIDRMINTDATDTEVANWLFGANQVGLKGESVRLAQRLKGTLGEDSPEWNAIREAAWRKVVEKPGDATQFGPQAVAERINKFVNGEGRPLANALYSPDELAQMRRFGSAMRILVPPPEATNPSKSSYGVSRLMGNWLSNLAGAIGWAQGGPAAGVGAREVVNVGLGLKNAVKSARAVAGAPRALTPAPALLPPLGSVAGYLGSSSASGR